MRPNTIITQSNANAANLQKMLNSQQTSTSSAALSYAQVTSILSQQQQQPPTPVQIPAISRTTSTTNDTVALSQYTTITPAHLHVAFIKKTH